MFCMLSITIIGSRYLYTSRWIVAKQESVAKWESIRFNASSVKGHESETHPVEEFGLTGG